MNKWYIFNTEIRGYYVSQVYAASEEEAIKLLEIPYESEPDLDGEFITGIVPQSNPIIMRT